MSTSSLQPPRTVIADTTAARATLTSRRAFAMPTGMGDRDAARRTLVADPEVRAAIAYVVKKRGVPPSEVDDVVNDVLAAALVNDKLPIGDREQDRLYLCGMARHQASEHARARKRRAARTVQLREEPPANDTLSAEQRVLASTLLDLSARKFPRAHSWFARFALEGESHADIAKDARVAESRVRGQISDVRRALRQAALAGAAAIVLLLIGLRLLRLPGGHPVGGHDVAQTGTVKPPVPVPSVTPQPSAPNPDQVLASALRDRARREMARGDWDLAALDFDRAFGLDPQGESRETRHLRYQAEQKLPAYEAKPHRP